MKKTTILILLLILASFAIAFYFYPLMPDRIASHWNAQGEVNGYMGKFWGLFMIPLMMVFFTILFLILPEIDPERKNIEKFRGIFDWFIVVFNLFILYIYILTILWNLGRQFNMTVALMPAFAGLFYFAGILIGDAKRNYTIGIRLPWTLANDVVWDKTHKLGEKLFKLTAIITLFGTVLPQYAFWLLFAPLTLSIIYLVVYSYLEFRRVAK